MTHHHRYAMPPTTGTEVVGRFSLVIFTRNGVHKQVTRTLAAFLALAVVTLSGCSTQQLDPRPIPEPEARESPKDADTGKTATTGKTRADEAQGDGLEKPVQTVTPPPEPMPWDQERDFSGKGSVANLEDVNIALATLYRMSSLAFMGPVIKHVESAMGLQLGGNQSASTHQCPQGGSFRREWDQESAYAGKPRTVRYEFNECQGRFREGRVVRLNGAYSRTFEPVAEEDHVRLDIDVSGWLLGADGSETPIRLHGTQKNERPQEGGIIRETPKLELYVGDAYTALVSFREAMTVLESQNPDEEFPAFSSSFETEYAGRLVSSRLGGSLEVSTPVKLMEQQPACAASGVYRFEGKNLADVRYGPDTGTMDRLVVEVDHARLKGFDSCDEFIRAIGFDGPRLRPF